jgi:hypothetical protein
MNLFDDKKLLQEVGEAMRDPEARLSLDELRIISYQFNEVVNPRHTFGVKPKMFKEIVLYHNSGYKITITENA